MELNKLTTETDSQYLWRLGSAKDAGLISLSWNELTDIINKNICADETEYLGSSAYRKKYSYAKEMYDEVFSKMNVANDTLNAIEKERKKLQTEKIEYNKWLREDARDELIAEKICEAVAKIEPLDIPKRIVPRPSGKSWLLVLADAHYGIEFELKDLYGEIINAYSPEIFEDRMALLFAKLVEMIEDEGIDELNIFDLGDGIQGIIRLNSQLMKLRYGIIDGSIRYAAYLANWLNELSKHVRIKFQMVKDSNHTQLRICDAPKNSFPEENMNKVMLTIIELWLKGNPNVVILQNPTGYCYANMSSWMVLGTHGEHKNFQRALDDFSRVYDTHIDYYICGHKHHAASEDIAVNREAITVRSIIGSDPYALSLNRTSNPGVSLFCFDMVDGLSREYRIKLD